jgi:hypothetical protein
MNPLESVVKPMDPFSEKCIGMHKIVVVRFIEGKHFWSLGAINYCGSTVVKVLWYKVEGRLFDSRWCHWNFSLT